MFRLLILARRLIGQLWVWVSAYAVLAVAAVLLAHIAAPLVPAPIAARFGPRAIIPVLSILASSMLAVSTFSLGIMVSAHRAAANTATPRVMALLLADETTRFVLSVFIGAFVYALTALILFYAGFDAGAPLVLGVTLLIVLAVVLALVRWISHLTTLGTLGDALERAERSGKAALQELVSQPALGGSPMTDDTVIPDEARALSAPTSGVLQAIDVAGIAAAADGPVWVLRRPGQVVLRDAPIVLVTGKPDEAALLRAFVIGNRRSYEQDPGFGLTVLSEIASRALSPAVNDPGTAIEVISRIERLLWNWGRAESKVSTPFPQVFIPAWTAEALIEAGFAPTARDGATQIEVVRQLIDALESLRASPNQALARAATAMAERARAHANSALRIEAERAMIPPARKSAFDEATLDKAGFERTTLESST